MLDRLLDPRRFISGFALRVLDVALVLRHEALGFRARFRVLALGVVGGGADVAPRSLAREPFRGRRREKPPPQRNDCMRLTKQQRATGKARRVRRCALHADRPSVLHDVAITVRPLGLEEIVGQVGDPDHGLAVPLLELLGEDGVVLGGPVGRHAEVPHGRMDLARELRAEGLAFFDAEAEDLRVADDDHLVALRRRPILAAVTIAIDAHARDGIVLRAEEDLLGGTGPEARPEHGVRYVDVEVRKRPSVSDTEPDLRDPEPDDDAEHASSYVGAPRGLHPLLRTRDPTVTCPR